MSTLTPYLKYKKEQMDNRRLVENILKTKKLEQRINFLSIITLILLLGLFGEFIYFTKFGI